MLVLTFILSLPSAYAKSNNNNGEGSKVINTNKVTINVNNKDYNVKIKDNAKGQLTTDMIKNIIQKDPTEGDIIVYDVGTQQNDLQTVKPMALPYFDITLEKTYSAYNMLHGTDFVTSVAKGETYQFSKSITFTNSASITGGATPFDIGITSSQSKTYQETWTFNGPPESSSYNSRSFYIDWYDNGGVYNRTCYLVNSNLRELQWSQMGVFYEPSKYVTYSRDSKI